MLRQQESPAVYVQWQQYKKQGGQNVNTGNELSDMARAVVLTSIGHQMDDEWFCGHFYEFDYQELTVRNPLVCVGEIEQDLNKVKNLHQ